MPCADRHQDFEGFHNWVPGLPIIMLQTMALRAALLLAASACLVSSAFGEPNTSRGMPIGRVSFVTAHSPLQLSHPN